MEKAKVGQAKILEKQRGRAAASLKALESLPPGLKLEEQRAKVRDAIENTKTFPGTGGVFNLSPQDHVGLNAKDVVLVKIADGNWVYLPREKW
jgi:branched-chain amino acid transport system substrate-binding protein